MMLPRRPSAAIVASVRPTPDAADGQEQIAAAAIEGVGNGRRIAPRGLAADDFGAGRAGAFRDELCGRRNAGGRRNIDDAQARAPHLQAFQSSRPRDQKIKRADGSPGRDGDTAFGDIAATAANALPRRRLRQHLSHQAVLIDQIGIDHAVATIRHAVAGFDPGRRPSQRQWRVGRRTGKVAGVQRPAIDSGPVAGRIRRQGGHIRRNAAQSLRQRNPDRPDRPQPLQQQRQRHIERRKRNRQALGRGHAQWWTTLFYFATPISRK